MKVESLQADALGKLLVAGHPRVLARLLRWQEDHDPRAEAVLQTVSPSGEPGKIVGLTGVPGAGKSSLGHRLIAAWRKAGFRVAVLAVDPSSPFSGGALLGDRVRMQSHASDPGVFVRSVATRGQLGGLSATTWQCVRTLQAAGFERILVETVGVGQDELDVAELADCTLVTLVPNLGDDIQNLKAGLMEIADVFCVNKVDLPGSERFVQTLEATLRLRPREERPPVVAISAATGLRMDTLMETVEAYLSELDATALSARRERRYRAEIRSRALSLVQRSLDEAIDLTRAPIAEYATNLADPGPLVRALLQRTLGDLAGHLAHGSSEASPDARCGNRKPRSAR